jgi:hypothetical protein
LVGIQVIDSSSTKVCDTLLNETVRASGTLFLLSGMQFESLRYDSHLFKSMGIEKCDTVFIYEAGTLSKVFINPYKDSSAIPDSLASLFEFEDRTKYILFETIDFESYGPQPKENKYWYRIE